MDTPSLAATSTGWIIALSDRSNWGSPSKLIHDLGLQRIRKNVFEIETTAWGKLPKDEAILSGEGVAFYHTQRADYGIGDLYKRRPRISMVGVLKEFELLVSDPRDPEYRLVLSFEMNTVNHLIRHPIVRNEQTKSLFESCGMVQGNIKTWYRAPLSAWKEIVTQCIP